MMSQPNEYIAGKINRDTSVQFHLGFAKEWLADPEITEICVNRPLEAWCESNNVWERHEVPSITYEHLFSLAQAIAKFAYDNVADIKPVMSAILPKGERVQVVIPPACEHGTISITIRKPSFQVRTLEDYEKQGFFKHIRPVKNGSTPDEIASLNPTEKELNTLIGSGKYLEFIRRAVQLEKVIVVAGETGSGKTTFMKALMQEIPRTQRIITIEDVPELFLPQHPNHIHLFYPSEAKEEENAIVTAATLLKSCLRMKPTRILLAELRGGEAYDFINVAASGHGGSITSIHAGSTQIAFERMVLMVLQNRQGRTLPYDVIKRLLHMVVDVVIHVTNDVDGGLGRHATEIWYDPMQKRKSSIG